jgi:quinol monooxygenase YgiN
MYGTVARFRLRPGAEDRLLALTREELATDPGPGFVALYLSRLDADPRGYAMTVVFDTEEHYRAHAGSPASEARYRQIADLLEGEPVWLDGEILLAETRGGVDGSPQAAG